MLSRVQLFAALWTTVHQVSLSVGFSRQESWSGLWFTTLIYIYIYTYTHIYIYTHTHTHTSIFSSVAQSCPTLCDPMNYSTPSLQVHHQLPELTQIHVHQVGNAIQLSHPLSSPSPPAPNPSQHQGFFQWVNSSHEVAKVLEFQLQHQSFQWTPRTDLL